MSNAGKTIVIRRQQSFERYDVLNSLEITINNDQILNIKNKKKKKPWLQAKSNRSTILGAC